MLKNSLKDILLLLGNCNTSIAFNKNKNVLLYQIKLSFITFLFFYFLEGHAGILLRKLYYHIYLYYLLK